MKGMSDWVMTGARRLEAYVRWSSYATVTIPTTTLLGSTRWSAWSSGADLAVPAAATLLSLLLSAGNIVIVNRSIDTVVGRVRPLRPALVAGWAAVLVALVAVALTLPSPAKTLTVAMTAGAVAASFAPALDMRRALLLNGAVVAVAALLTLASDPGPLLVGSAVASAALWVCWLSAWTLWVLRELQAAVEDRAALALANERLRIARDLHDVFGRTLATIAVKSALASELVDRGRADPAGRELGEIRRIAEEAGTEVRRVVRGELRTTWEGEVAGARSLLESAGIACTVTGDPVPQEYAEALGQVVREGVTNLLRHSQATRVSLTTEVGSGRVRLAITNDGVGPGDPGAVEGTGLHSMSERIGALGGSVTARRDGDRFLLDAVIPLPEEDPA